MPNHHFISYSVADASDFALKLCDELIAGPPPISAWLDKRDIQPGQDWDDQIVEALRTCDSLIFIMTRDSIESESGCKNEWTRAIKYKKHIIPILLHEDADMPFQLENRQYINFTGDFKTALAGLRKHIQWLDSSEGKLQALKDRLADANRDLRRTNDPVQQTRIKAEIDTLKQQIADQEKVVKDPEGARERVQESIVTGIERERQPEKPKTGVSRTKFINPPPGIAPTYFQNRHIETKLVGDFLKNEVERLMTVVGRGGIGKTAMVCRLLKSLEGGRLPENGKDQKGGEPLSVDGIVYLSERGSRKVNFRDLFFDLCLLLPDEVAEKLDGLYKDPKVSPADKMKALLGAFPTGRFVVLLDNFEDKVDAEREINDEEVNEALTALLTAEPHGVKVILTTRVAPKSLVLIEPSLQQALVLDEGLKSPYAETILREMDIDGKVGLKEASDELLDEARKRTNGYPRALEALFAILSADRETTLPEILADTQQILPEHVVEKMVGEAYSRLDPEGQRVMQALAIYGRPVSQVALNYLLQLHVVGVDSAKTLNRLFHMQFVRKEGKRYYLHPVDREYALGRIPKGKPSDREDEEPIFSQYSLLHRGAQYFSEIRLLRKDWKSIDNLAPQLAEFELRFEGEDYDTAASVLLEIDFDYLFLWGHYKLGATMHERLQGKIQDLNLKESNVGNLGTVYHSMGEYQKSIAYYEQALEIAREIGDRRGEGRCLGNLGVSYLDLGETRRAIEYYEQALKIACEAGDQRNEGNWLGNLGNCYGDLGDTRRAIEFKKQALEIACEIGDRGGEGHWLGNLGISYLGLGDTRRAIECYEQALEIACEIGDRGSEGRHLGNLGSRYSDLGEDLQAMEAFEQSLEIAKKIGYRVMEGANLTNIGEILLDRALFNEAVEKQHQAIQVADQIKHNQLRNLARYNLALTFLFQNSLHYADRVIKEAQQYDYPPNNYNIWKLQGLIHLLEKNLEEACKAFSKAITESEALLGGSAHNYRALDAKGLSLCGLALCNKDSHSLEEAKQAYTEAREINIDQGYVKRVLRLFDKLAEMDKEGMLKDLRMVVSGK